MELEGKIFFPRILFLEQMKKYNTVAITIKDFSPIRIIKGLATAHLQINT